MKWGIAHTRRHEQRISLLGIRMGSLPTLRLVECAATDFASLDSCLTKGGQVLPRAHIVIDTQTDLGTAVAHEAESPHPVSNQEAGGVIGGCLAGGGTEADGGEESINHLINKAKLGVHLFS